MITKNQWCTINLNQLGLRSEDNATVIKGSGATYAMDMGMPPYKPGDSVPKNWDELLRGTIQYMKGFKDSAGRYLMIVQTSTGENTEYRGCFPKCSHRAETVLHATSLARPLEELVRWVESNI
ncbi:hypothetical protein GA398_13015 [Bacteroides xylanisolvens]|jgi:hypothetical protein|uniref:Uncharacterized protein n=1 Tax=Bacteroides xylanisolvens TaxID=371601 RepID=A0A7J5PVR3_9BACE|nr:hypothetical protein [Bacteroides xylanisolvens]KAB6147083.1 hypothetical protein GA398_13015 [Bacteroides xylanisolvens]